EVLGGGGLVDQLQLAAIAAARTQLPELAELRLSPRRAVEVDAVVGGPDALGAIEDGRALGLGLKTDGVIDRVGFLDRRPLALVRLAGRAQMGIEVRPAADDERPQRAAERRQIARLPRLPGGREAIEARVSAVLGLVERVAEPRDRLVGEAAGVGDRL